MSEHVPTWATSWPLQESFWHEIKKAAKAYEEYEKARVGLLIALLLFVGGAVVILMTGNLLVGSFGLALGGMFGAFHAVRIDRARALKMDIEELLKKEDVQTRTLLKNEIAKLAPNTLPKDHMYYVLVLRQLKIQ